MRRQGALLAALVLVGCSSRVERPSSAKPLPRPVEALLLGAAAAPPRPARDGFVIDARPSRGALPVRASLGPTGADAFSITSGAVTMRVRRRGASAVPGVVEGAALCYRGVLAGADAVVVSRQAAVEELIVDHEGRGEVVYDLELPDRHALRAHERLGLVEVTDERGVARLRIRASEAWDGDGRAAPVKLTVAGQALRLEVSAASGPVIVDPVFTSTSAMAIPRVGHTMTVLRDGRVLVAGGLDAAGSPLDTAEIYDPTTGTFSLVTARLHAPRASHSATLLRDGRVLLAGGDGEVVARSAELVDPHTGETTSVVGGLVAARAQHAAVSLADGRVLLSGGQGEEASSSLEVFDASTGVSSAIGASMLSPRYAHTATLLADGRVLLAGGSPFSGAELFDPVTNERKKVEEPEGWAPYLHTSTLLADGRVLIAGGMAQSLFDGAAFVFDPAGDAVVKLDAAMVSARVAHCATLLDDGRVLFVGGNDGEQPLSLTETFDPASASFSAERASLGSPRYGAAATLLADGRVLVTGGQVDEGLLLDGAEVFDARATWLAPASTKLSLARSEVVATKLADGRVLTTGGGASLFEGGLAELFHPDSGLVEPVSSGLRGPRTGHSAALLADGRVLLTGGQGEGLLDSAELFEPATRAFSLTGSMSAARYRHTVTTLSDGRVLVVGGMSTEATLDTAELFDPAAGAFTSAGSKMAAPRHAHSATLIDDGRVLVVGGTANEPDSHATLEIYDPKSGFSLVDGQLAAARREHSATLLSDGRVLIAGGMGSFEPLDTIETFDPKTMALAPPGKLALARALHGAARLTDGRVLLAGGFGAAGCLDSAELFDPVTGESALVASKLLRPRCEPFALSLDDGRVALIGGRDDAGAIDTIELYDPSLGAFVPATRPSCSGCLLTEGPAGALLSGAADGTLSRVSPGGAPGGEQGKAMARRRHTATVDADGAIVLAGGEVETPQRFTGAIERVRGDGVIESLGALVTPRAGHAAVRLSDGRVLFVGGESQGGLVTTYEVLAAGEATPGQVGELARPRKGHGAALLPDGRVLIAGGTGERGAELVIEVFDPWSGAFTEVSQQNLGNDVSFAYWADGALALSGELGAARVSPLLAVSKDGALTGGRLLTLPQGDVAACLDRCLVVGAGAGVIEGPAVGLGLAGQAKVVGSQRALFAGPGVAGGWYGWAFTQPPTATRPVLGPLESERVTMGAVLALSGERLGRCSAVGAGDRVPSVSNVALVAFRPLDGAGPVHFFGTSKLTDTSVEATVPHTAYTGPGWLYVMVDGVASDPRLLTILPSELGAACTQGAECVSGHCVDGLCCDEACSDACRACSAAQKWQGVDGRCEPIAQGRAPRRGGCQKTGEACGPTGSCEGNGACSLPGIETRCTGVEGGRCQEGFCKLPPAPTCDTKNNELVAVDGTTRPCTPGLCVDGACTLSCSDDGGCDEGALCVDGGCIGARCDDTGARVLRLDGPPSSCSPYRCDRGACRSSCQGESECAEGALCIEGRCADGCSADRGSVLSLTTTGPVERSCEPYRCERGQCISTCQSHDDCQPPARCGDTGRCAVAPLPSEARDPGACSHAPGRPRGGLLALGIAALAIGRRRATLRAKGV